MNGATSSTGARPPVSVAYLHHRAEISGGENSLLMLWEHLDRQRFRPFLLGAPEGDFVREARALDVECRAAVFPRLGEYIGATGWRQIEQLDRQLTRIGAALVHGNAPHTNVAGAFSGRRSRQRVIWHGRTLLRPADYDIERILRRLADRIICNSAAVARRFGGTSDRVSVVLNGVELERFRPHHKGDKFRGELGLRPEQVAIGSVGNMSPWKKHELFLDAAAIVASRHPDVRFVVVGGEVFPENKGREAQLRNRVAAAGIEDNLIFTGPRSDMPAVFDGLDLVVSTATAEACSRAIVEALASGTPVVAAAAGGNPELVADGDTGRLFVPDDPMALATALDELIVAVDRRQAMGATARRRAERQFSIERQTRQIEAVYADLLGKP